MTKQMSPYAAYETVGWSAAKVVMSTEGDGDGDPARKVTLGQDFPLRPPPPVQFVLCFDDDPLNHQPEAGISAFCVGFREKDGVVKLIPASAWDVVNGLAKLRTVMVQLARQVETKPERPR